MTCNLWFAKRLETGSSLNVQALEKIEREVKRLTRAEQEALRDWLENLLEDRLEMKEEFKAKIERGEQDIREGRTRVRKP